MTANRSGAGPDDGDTGTWASEILPLSVRKELLERELNRLGIRRTGAQGGSTGHEGAASQQQADSGSSHPQAGSTAEKNHGD